MKFSWRGALGIAVSIVFLWWAFHGINFAEVWREVRHANLALLALSAAVATCIFPLRAIRWRPILAPIQPNLPFGALFRATAIGMMVNNVVPARAGELARAFALTREKPSVPFSAAFASLAVDRLFDALVIVLLLLLSMLAPSFPGDMKVAGQPVANWAGTGIVVAVALMVILYFIVLFPARLISIYEAFARKVAPRFEERGRELLLAFASGLGVLRSPGQFFIVFAWTVVHWLTNCLAFWIGFKAVGIDVPFSAAVFIQCIICLGVALPAAPGFFGIFELVAKEGLGVFGVPEPLALSWAISFHIASFIPITLIGAYYFARLGMHFSDIEQATPAGDAKVGLASGD
jgi:glycosyltransferase 2 family protein